MSKNKLFTRVLLLILVLFGSLQPYNKTDGKQVGAVWPCENTASDWSKPQPKVEFPVLKGPYLGQKPPGKMPVKFPFDYMPPDYKLHSAPASMPSGEEVYFSAMDFSVRFSEKIFFMKIVDGTWTPPRVAPFSGNTFDGSPSLSRDGRYLFFSSARKQDGDGMNESGERNIWYVERLSDEWSTPICRAVITTIFCRGYPY